VKLTTHLLLVPRSKNAWSYTSTPPVRLHGVVLSLGTGTTSPLPSKCHISVEHSILMVLVSSWTVYTAAYVFGICVMYTYLLVS
jgi:hypothetical protein